MITVICFEEREIVARLQGHGSWINSIAFDPWRCDGRNYRVGSVADDRRLLLWDFNASMLQRPRAVSLDHRTHRAAMNRCLTINRDRDVLGQRHVWSGRPRGLSVIYIDEC